MRFPSIRSIAEHLYFIRPFEPELKLEVTTDGRASPDKIKLVNKAMKGDTPADIDRTGPDTLLTYRGVIANQAKALVEDIDELPFVESVEPLEDDDAENSGSLDVRLHIDEQGGWEIHTGDPSTDDDHRGYWGTGTLTFEDNKGACMNLARDLIEEAKEDYSQKNS